MNIFNKNNQTDVGGTSKNSSTETTHSFGSWNLDIKKDTLVWSEGALSVFGIAKNKKNEKIRKAFYKLVHPDDIEKVKKSLADCIDKKNPYQCEYRIIKASGSVHYICAYGDIIFDQQGDINFILGTVVDITELKKVEETRRVMEMRLLESQRISHIGNWEHNLIDDSLYWSDEYFRICGLKPQEFTPCREKFKQVIHPDDYDERIELFEKTLKSKKPFKMEYRIIRPDGEIRNIKIDGEYLFEDGKEPHALQGTFHDVTDQKRAEEKAKTFEKRVLETQKTSHLGNWHLDYQTGVTYWSDEIYRMLGFEPQSLVPPNGHFFTFVHPDDLDYTIFTIEKALETGEVFNIDMRIIRPSGEIRYIYCSGKTTYDNDGKPARMDGILHDITGRKLAEIAAKVAEERMLEAHRIGGLGHWNWDMTNDITYWSDQVYKIYDYDKDTVDNTYENFRVILHPDDADHHDKAFEIAIENHEDFYVEHRLVLKSGDIKTVIQQGEIIYNEAGDAIKAHGVIQDITKIKIAEEAAKSSEARLSEIFNIAPAAIITTDNEMKITIFNKFAVEIFGYNAKEVIGKHIEVLIPEQYHADHHSKIDQFNNSQHRSREMNDRTGIFGRRKDGRIFSAAASVSAIGEGNDRAYTIVLLDTTERIKEEQERALILTEAQNANRAKSQFLATMSHELRTPLNAIIGFSEMMTNRVYGKLGSDKYEEYAHDIVGSSRHLLNLVNDILDLSEIEAGGKSLNIKHISLRDTVEDCQYIIFKLAEDKKIKCDINITDDIPLIYADQRALKQIIINIMTNAIKYTQDGGQIEFTSMIDENKHLIKIIDNGEGIPADKIDDIIKPFTRVENNPYTSNEGKGLGLAIVQSLMNLHEGSLKIDSVYKSGTTVTLSFPIKN